MPVTPNYKCQFILPRNTTFNKRVRGYVSIIINVLLTGVIMVCSKNICPPVLGKYIFHVPLLGFKISPDFILMHN